MEEIHGRRHRATLQNYKATWTSLLTNEKAKSTFTTSHQDDFFAWIALQREPWTSYSSWLITRLVTKLTRWVPLVVQELPTLQSTRVHPGFKWGSCYLIFSFVCMCYRSLFVLFPLASVFCTSLIDIFWLSLWYPQTLLSSNLINVHVYKTLYTMYVLHTVTF